MAEKKTEASIRQFAPSVVRVRIRGMEDCPLVVHNFSEKAKQQIRDKQQQKGKAKKDAKDPAADFNASRYVVDGRDCIKAVSLKSAIVSACRFLEDLKMTVVRGAVFVRGEWLEIQGAKPVMREDAVTIGIDTRDLRYRPEYRDWYIEAAIEFIPSAVSESQLRMLLDVAGFSVGLCENRPEKSGGSWGRFTVESVEAL